MTVPLSVPKANVEWVWDHLSQLALAFGVSVSICSRELVVRGVHRVIKLRSSCKIARY